MVYGDYPHAKDQMQCGSYFSKVELSKQSIIYFVRLHRLALLLKFVDTHICNIMCQQKQSDSSIMVTPERSFSARLLLAFLHAVPRL